MATKKGKRTAKVQLDAATVHQFNNYLREGLVSSGARMATDTPTPEPTGDAKVELDADTAARVSEVLRKGLVGSQVVMATDLAPLAKKKATKAKAKSTKRPTKKS